MPRKQRAYQITEESYDPLSFSDSDFFHDDVAGTDIDENITYVHSVTARRFMVEANDTPLKDLFNELPSPDTDIYLFNRPNKHVETVESSFDYIHLLCHFASLLKKDVEAHISTWSMGIDHARFFIGSVETGIFKHLCFVLDKSFRNRMPAVYTNLTTGMRKHNMPFAVIKNHCKVALLTNGVQKVTIMGSSNITTMPRTENFTISTSPQLYDFVRTSFFEAVLRGK